MSNELEKLSDRPADMRAFNSTLAVFNSHGWTVASDGPTGVQMNAPKKMRGLDKACLVIGVIGLIFYGIGLLFIAIALIDFYCLTKSPARFIYRPAAKAGPAGEIE